MSGRHRVSHKLRGLGTSAWTLLAIAAIAALYLIVLSRGQIFHGRLW